jgi:hypothetical protein
MKEDFHNEMTVDLQTESRGRIAKTETKIKDDQQTRIVREVTNLFLEKKMIGPNHHAKGTMVVLHVLLPPQRE